MAPAKVLPSTSTVLPLQFYLQSPKYYYVTSTVQSTELPPQSTVVFIYLYCVLYTSTVFPPLSSITSTMLPPNTQFYLHGVTWISVLHGFQLLPLCYLHRVTSTVVLYFDSVTSTLSLVPLLCYIQRVTSVLESCTSEVLLCNLDCVTSTLLPLQCYLHIFIYLRLCDHG